MKDKIETAIKAATNSEDIKLDMPSTREYGDYATNIALSLAKRQKTTALELAKDIVAKLNGDAKLKKYISKIEIAGPGFINFWLTDETLAGVVSKINKEKARHGTSKEGKGKTVVIDYSSPNIAKRFSIGHLRSTIIGQALYNLYSALGYKVIGDNHLGDWGTQFGVLIYMVESGGIDAESLSIDDWEKLYVEFHARLDEQPELKDKAREAFARLEKGDEPARKIWQIAMDTSMSEYNKIYKRLNVKIDFAYGESFYEDKMPEAINQAVKKGIAVKSGKALAVEFGKKYNLPSNLLVKSNGTTTYLARDLAVMFYRKKRWNPDLQIFEVGADQSLYFKQVFSLAEMMGLFNLAQLKHVAHGMIRLPKGKMSTRKGQTIKLEEVLNKAVEEARKLGAKETKLAEQVGIGAIKYFDLKHTPTNDIVFDWNEVLDLKGNSGPYLQYTYARCRSIVTKAGGLPEIKTTSTGLDGKERSLARVLIHYPQTVKDAAINYSPHLLANYLFNLAQEFNSFYNSERVIGSTRQRERLLLISAVSQIIKNGLNLLGLETPEKM